MKQPSHIERWAAAAHTVAFHWRRLRGETDGGVVPLDYRKIATQPEDIRDWALFGLAREVSERAEQRRRVGITLVDMAAMNALRAQHARFPIAVAYQVGSTVMAAEVPEQVQLTAGNQNYAFAMTLDKLPVIDPPVTYVPEENTPTTLVPTPKVKVTAGLLHPDERTLIVPHNAVHAGRTVDVADGNFAIPILK